MTELLSKWPAFSSVKMTSGNGAPYALSMINGIPFSSASSDLYAATLTRSTNSDDSSEEDESAVRSFAPVLASLSSLRRRWEEEVDAEGDETVTAPLSDAMQMVANRATKPDVDVLRAKLKKVKRPANLELYTPFGKYGGLGLAVCCL